MVVPENMDCPSQQRFAFRDLRQVTVKIRPVIKNKGVVRRKRYGDSDI